MSKPSRILVIGDLHLFAKRSQGSEHWDKISKIIGSKSIDRCIFIGDLFDFSWCLEYSRAESVKVAAKMLEILVREHHLIRFDYLLGNHDDNPRFKSELHSLCQKEKNLKVHPAHLKVGQTLFLHGDVVDRKSLGPENISEHRLKWSAQKTHSKLLESIYGILVQVRVDEMGGLLKFLPPLVIHRLHDYLKNCDLEEINCVVFGHTHRRLDHVSKDIRFVNLGAPIGKRVYRHEILEVVD